MTNARRSLLFLACSAALGLASPTYALYSGTTLTGSQVPDWAVGNYSCSGTLITPRVMVTAGHCTSNYPNYGFYWRKNGQLYYGKTATYPTIYGPLGDVGIVMTDTAFGAASGVRPATVASYQEEQQFLRNGDDALTTGTPLVVYGRDSASGNFATASRNSDAFTGTPLSNGYLEGRKMFYRTVSKYRLTEPARLKGLMEHSYANIFNANLAALMYTDANGLHFTDTDADDTLVLTAPPLNTKPASGSPIFSGDSGGGIFLRRPDGDLRLISNVSGFAAHPRLSNYWPWIVKTLIEKGLREDAMILSRQVLGTPEWGTNRRTGQVGQIFVYDNPYSRKIEYFRLVGLTAIGQYEYFPINQSDNEFWEYLGTTLPNIEQATTKVLTQRKDWGSVDRRLSVGNIFIYNNPYSRRTEYFRLAALGNGGHYMAFPINQQDNYYWKYLGTDLPTRPLKFVPKA